MQRDGSRQRTDEFDQWIGVVAALDEHVADTVRKPQEQAYLIVVRAVCNAKRHVVRRIAHGVRPGGDIHHLGLAARDFPRGKVTDSADLIEGKGGHTSF